MKKCFILVLLSIMLLGSCKSYVAVSNEKPAEIDELNGMDKLGVVVLLKVSGNGHLAIGIGGDSEWSVANYSELDGSVVIYVTDDEIKKSFMTTDSIAAEISKAASEVFGKGQPYEYRYMKGYAIKPFIVSNKVDEADGSVRMIESPEVVSIESDFKYNVKDKDIIPFAIKAGAEEGIDALVVIRAELITEGGKVTAYDSGETTGYAVGDYANTLEIGDYFVRNELYVNECSVIDAKTGEYIKENFSEFSGSTVFSSNKFKKLEGVYSGSDLNAYFRNGEYQKQLKESAKVQLSPIIPYIRPHLWTYYEEE